MELPIKLKIIKTSETSTVAMEQRLTELEAIIDKAGLTIKRGFVELGQAHLTI